MTSSLLQGKAFFCREWVFGKIARCLEPPSGEARDFGGSSESGHALGPGVQCEGQGSEGHSPCSVQRPTGTIIMGGPGCGKTALCCEIIWPTASSRGGKVNAIGQRAIAYYFCQAHDVETLSVANFILCIADQISRSLLVDVKRRSVQDKRGLDPVLCETDPDQAFMTGVLEPLLAVSPTPSETLFILVDSLDESYLQSFSERASGSRTIAELLAAHHHLLPQWLYLVCTSRKQTKSITRLFAGFRKISLDDQRKTRVVRDVQQYILCRLDRDDRLRQQLSRETAEMLNQLHIKSNGCMLYLEKVLDGVVDGFIRLEEIRDMPGTLNGLYLWLCQRLFTSKSFAIVRPILNVIFAARRPLTDIELYSCVVTQNKLLTYVEFTRHMTALSRILTQAQDGTRILFHHSFAEWLLDVKYCTQRYLCVPSEGHAMLALSFTLHAQTLSPVETHHFAFHVAKCGLGLESFHYPLWLIVSGSGVVDSLTTSIPREQAAIELLLRAGARLPTDEALVSSMTGMSSADDREPDCEDILHREPTCDELDSNGRTALCNAAFQGNIAHVHALLARITDERGVSRVSVEAVDGSGQTALCLAARHGHADVVAALIEAGSTVDHADHDGWTALRSAAWGGHGDVVARLLSAGAVVDCRDRDGRTALRAAAWGGHLEIVQMLVDGGAKVNHIDNEGRTALIAAAYMGHCDVVDLLLSLGADANHADIDGRTALSVAALCIPASQSHCRVVAALVEHGAAVDHTDKDGMTPFCVAAYEGHAEICEILLENEADMDHTDASGRSALEGAVCMGHAPVVRLLLFWGAYVDMIDSDGRTVLCSAAQQGSVEVVQLLLDRGLDETHRDNYGWSPLHIAAFEGHAEVVRTLLEAGAHVLECDNDGRIPLLLAAQEGHMICVAILLDAGSPIEAHGHDGKSALRLAALEGHTDVVLCLLRYGSNIDRLDPDHRSTVYALTADNQPAMTALLLDHGADPSLADTQRRAPLHVAAWAGNLELVELLLDHGADPDARDRELRTPLQAAAWGGHAEVAEVLLTRGGSDVDHACGEGATALGVAVQEGHEAVVRVLLRYNADVNHADARGRTPMHIALAGKRPGIISALQGGSEAQGKGVPERSTNKSRAQVAGKQQQYGGDGARNTNHCRGDQHKRSSGELIVSKVDRCLNRLSGGSHSGSSHVGSGQRMIPSQSERLANYAGSSDDGRVGGVSTSPVVTSGVSSIDAKYSSSSAFTQAVVTTSASALCPSNHSSSKSSGIHIGSNSLSTNLSSSSGEAVGGRGAGVGVARGGGDEGGVGVVGPLTFVQELQQCSGPRSHKNRSLTRILSPVTEPTAVAGRRGKKDGEKVKIGSGDKKNPAKSVGKVAASVFLNQSSSSPARLGAASRKSTEARGVGKVGGDGESVWLRQKTDGSSVVPPDTKVLSAIKTTDEKRNCQSTDAPEQSGMEANLSRKIDHPSELNIKKETPL